VATIWEELKRRNVVRATLAYVVVGWLLAQVAEFATSTFGAPVWVLKIFVVFLVLGLPLVVILAWAYEMTPHGLRKADETNIAQSANNATRPKRNIAFAGMLATALLIAAWLQFSEFDSSYEAARSSDQEVSSGVNNPAFSYHFDLVLPNEAPLALIGAAALGNGRQAFAISPDGTKIIYVADKGGSYQLYLRELDGHDAQAVPDTENAYSPFFSPNGVWVGFFVGNQLKKIRLDGGNSVLVTEATNSVGATWLENDEIILATNEGNVLQRVSAQGGPLEFLRNEASFPRGFSGKSDIVLISTGSKTIIVFNTETQESITLPIAGDEARYANGFLFYIYGSSLYAARFNPDTLTLGSTPIPVLTGVRAEVYGIGQWSISDNGILLFMPGTSAGSNPMYWADAAANEALDLPLRERGSFEISPDGRQFAVIEASAGTADIWIYDFEKYQPRKLTVEGQFSGPLFWMPDGKSIVYHKNVGQQRIPYRQYLDVGGSGEPFLSPDFVNLSAVSISRDGRYVGASDIAAGGIGIIDLVDQTTTAVPTVGEDNWGTAISPDGRFIVYTSAESGVYQNYLQPLPPTGARYQVSRVGGAEEPRWSRDGERVFYRSGNRIMAASITTEPELKIGEPEVLFGGEFENVGGRSYEVHPDDQRVLVIRADNAAESIRIVTNWFGEVDRMIRENEALSLQLNQ
jgi:Tol biopolymer transport system component